MAAQILHGGISAVEKQLRLSTAVVEVSGSGLFAGLVAAEPGTQWPCFLQLRPPCFSLQSQAEVICCDVGSALQVITLAPVSASVQGGRELNPSSWQYPFEESVYAHQ